MPNTVPVNDSVAGLEWMLDAARGAVVKLFAMPAATFGSMGEEITDFHELQQAGAVGFTHCWKPVLHDPVMPEALVAAARTVAAGFQHFGEKRAFAGCDMTGEAVVDGTS